MSNKQQQKREPEFYVVVNRKILNQLPYQRPCNFWSC